MIIIDYEIVVRYKGDISTLENELNIHIEILSSSYAILILNNKNDLKKILEYEQIEAIENSFNLKAQHEQRFSSIGITSLKNNTGLTGENTIIGVIDTGIDYTLPVFRHKDGKSKIIYYLDENKSIYTNEDINKAIEGNVGIQIPENTIHGTQVASVCCSIANGASMIIVKLKEYYGKDILKSTDFMRAIKFILDKSYELQMPVVINISHGTDETSHRGLTLFEQYVNDMCKVWKNNIVVAAGNNRSGEHHKRVKLKHGKTKKIELIIDENEKNLNMDIWSNLDDEFEVCLLNTTNMKSKKILLSQNGGENSYSKINLNYKHIEQYSNMRKTKLKIKCDAENNCGLWKIIFKPIKIIDGNVDIYLRESPILNKNTRFLYPNSKLTVMAPATANNVLTVGSCNWRNDMISNFSANGDIDVGIDKPDILAPGENILSHLPGGTKKDISGTSIAASHVSGVCLLLMEWGIVRGNDIHLYSDKLKELILNLATIKSSKHSMNHVQEYRILNLDNINIE